MLSRHARGRRRRRAAGHARQAAPRGRRGPRRRAAGRRPAGAARGRPGRAAALAGRRARRRRPRGDGRRRRRRPARRDARRRPAAAARADGARRGRAGAPADDLRRLHRRRSDDLRAGDPAARRDRRRGAGPGPQPRAVARHRRAGVRGAPAAGHARPARFLGTAHIQRLLREPPSALVSGIVENDTDPLRPDTPIDDITRHLATYNLVAAPVVDDARPAARRGVGRRRARPPAARGLARHRRAAARRSHG